MNNYEILSDFIVQRQQMHNKDKRVQIIPTYSLLTKKHCPSQKKKILSLLKVVTQS